MLLACLFALPAVFCLAWVLLVDRDTLRDAPRDREGSVEAQWLTRAQSGAFTDLVAVAGLTLVADLFVELPSASGLLLVGLLLAMLDCAARYLWLTKREG